MLHRDQLFLEVIVLKVIFHLLEIGIPARQNKGVALLGRIHVSPGFVINDKWALFNRPKIRMHRLEFTL
jgi:hypothetical protein